MFTLIGSTVLNAIYFLPILYRAWLLPETTPPGKDHGEAPWPMVETLSDACESAGKLTQEAGGKLRLAGHSAQLDEASAKIRALRAQGAGFGGVLAQTISEIIPDEEEAHLLAQSVMLAFDAALLMLGFGMGTLPAMLLVGSAFNFFKGWVKSPLVRTSAGVLLIAFGVYSVYTGLGHSHHHHANLSSTDLQHSGDCSEIRVPAILRKVS